MRSPVLVAALALLACEPREVVPPIPVPDAPPIDGAFDGHFPIVHRDGGPDAPTPSFDAPPPEGGFPDTPTDGGRLELVVDGTLDEEIWLSGSTTTTTTVTAVTPFAGCSMSELLVAPGRNALYLGVRGGLDGLCASAGIVVYVDVNPGSGMGVVLTGVTGTDTSGALDRVLATPLTAVDPEIRPDFAWGSVLMPAPLGGPLRAEVGWRNVTGTTYSSPTGQLSACTTTECETAIPYSSLGLTVGTYPLRFFARMGNGSEWATPTLPPGDDAPFVTFTLSVEVAVP